jgi:hypothetical protein
MNMAKDDVVPGIVETIKVLDRNVILTILHDVHEYLDTTEAPRSGHQQEHGELSKEIDTFGKTEHGKKLFDHMHTLKKSLGVKARSILALVKHPDMQEAMDAHEDHAHHRGAMKQMLKFVDKREHITENEKGRQKVKKAKKLAAKKAKKAEKAEKSTAGKSAAKKAKKSAAEKSAAKKANKTKKLNCKMKGTTTNLVHEYLLDVVQVY